ncbi:MAG: Gx transporter family protein [Clostridiales bacterium]|nr:Gx transporter family protein [Clostridiales bacterium]
MMRFPAKVMTQTALCTAVALIFSYIESLVPLNSFIPIPGFRIGLANIAVLYLFYESKLRAFLVMLMKVFLSAFLFGTGISFWFALSGGIFSFLAMMLASLVFKDKISYIGLSVSGAVFHNIGQLLVSSIVIGVGTAYTYAPFLIVAGVFSGILCGFLLNLLADRIKGAIKKIEH